MRPHPKQKGSAIRKPSQSFIDIQMFIKQARVQLVELSSLLASWKAFNEEATERLAIAAIWDGEVQGIASPKKVAVLAQKPLPIIERYIFRALNILK